MVIEYNEHIDPLSDRSNGPLEYMGRHCQIESMVT